MRSPTTCAPPGRAGAAGACACGRAPWSPQRPAPSGRRHRSPPTGGWARLAVSPPAGGRARRGRRTGRTHPAWPSGPKPEAGPLYPPPPPPDPASHPPPHSTPPPPPGPPRRSAPRRARARAGQGRASQPGGAKRSARPPRASYSAARARSSALMMAGSARRCATPESSGRRSNLLQAAESHARLRPRLATAGRCSSGVRGSGADQRFVSSQVRLAT